MQVRARVGPVYVRCDPQALGDLGALHRMAYEWSEEARPPLQPPRSTALQRPSVRYNKKDALPWLRYAVACVQDRRRRERVGLHQQAVKQRVHDMKRYRHLYAAALASALATSLGHEIDDTHTHMDSHKCGSPPPPSAAAVDESCKLTDLEMGLPLAAIMALRNRCEDQVLVADKMIKTFEDRALACSSSLNLTHPPHSASSPPPARLPTRPSLGYFWWLRGVMLARCEGGEGGAARRGAGGGHGVTQEWERGAGSWREMLVLLLGGASAAGDQTMSATTSLGVSVELERWSLEVCEGNNKSAPRRLGGSVAAAVEAVAVARLHVSNLSFNSLT